MFPLKVAVSLLLLCFGSHAIAGSHVWQPALVRKDNTTKSTRSLGKRYNYANPDTSIANRVPWPDRKIRYCFNLDHAETQSRKSTLNQYIKEGHRLWISKGLSSSFKIEKVSDKACVDDRNNVLKITYSDSSTATFVGFPDESIKMSSTSGPEMYITDITTIGLLDVVNNCAHELGHAWGLFHEHQNPNFWKGVTSANAGEVWGPDNPGGWNCNNLKDYYSTSVGFVVQTGGNGNRNVDINQLCSSWSIAMDRRFSAYDYLPMPHVGVSHHPNGHGQGDVDWDSMMLYPSGAGGVISDGSVPTPANDNRAPILRKMDGSRIPINNSPSALDIQALNTMYENITPVKGGLLQSTKNTFSKVFKSSGSGPSGGSGCL